jgi:hypothetical protein
MVKIKIETLSKKQKDFKYMSFGITNQCKDGFQLPFFDYDFNDVYIIMSELKKIQQYYKLSNIYFIKSTNGFNAFSFDKLNYSMLKEIYKTCQHVDKDFIKYGLKRGFFTLRMGKDKIFKSTIFSNNNNYIKSLPHKKFFVEIMSFYIPDDNNFDNENNLVVTTFPSNKYGFNKEIFKDG